MADKVSLKGHFPTPPQTVDSCYLASQRNSNWQCSRAARAKGWRVCVPKCPATPGASELAMELGCGLRGEVVGKGLGLLGGMSGEGREQLSAVMALPISYAPYPAAPCPSLRPLRLAPAKELA